jgi:hypothetical protein
VGLRLVNTIPGTILEPVKPGQPAQLGLRSENGLVSLGSLRVTMGLTSIHYEGLLPAVDPNLAARGASVVYETPERARPVAGSVVAAISGPNIVFSKSDSSQNDLSIFEIESAIRTGAPVLGYFKFLTHPSWALATRPWSSAAVSGVYLGLEHGEFNTACYAFLGSHKLVTGGPLQSWNSARPSQQDLTYDWTSPAPGSEFEVWVYFNIFGYPPPFSPSYTPVAEVWVRCIGTDAFPVRLCRIPVGALGVFPTINGGMTNTRKGPSSIARLFFGFSGGSSEAFTLEDWALFPDYRVSVSEGMALPQNGLLVLPDSPYEYRPVQGLPNKVVPGRWAFLSDAGSIPPAAALTYAPGQKKIPSFISLEKSVSSPSGFEKQEPRLESSRGFMMEAFMAGLQSERVSDQTGSGFLVEDGGRSYRVSLLATPSTKTVGLLTNAAAPGVLASYLHPTDGLGAPQEVDWTSLKRVRIACDRESRGKVGLFIEDEFIGEVTVASMPTSPGPIGRVAFGHLVSQPSAGVLQIAFLNYLSQYQAWEGIDALRPDAGSYSFSQQGAGDALMDGEVLVLSKLNFGVPASCNFFSKSTVLTESVGLLVDFQAKVNSYTDQVGRGSAALCWVGAGLNLLLGTKKLHLGFFDCGTFGRKIGIIPGSGSVDDIINQTALGRAFSAAVDWTQMQSYRLVYKAYDRIEVWVGNVAGESVLTIPWTPDGFDLPEDLSDYAIQFGHFDADSSSKTEWGYVRWGASSGYDVAVQQEFSELSSYLFGGRAVVLPTFDELELES